MAVTHLDTHAHSTPKTTTTTNLPSPTVVAPPSLVDPEIADGASSVDYASRANWLRAAVLGANDGLVSVASAMIGVSAVSSNAREMVVSGLAGLVAGACSMAIGEFVSVYAQYDIQKAEMDRREGLRSGKTVEDDEREELPSPTQAALASALAFMIGGVLPLLGGGFVRQWGARVGAVCAVSSVGLAGFGAGGGYLGGASPGRCAVRVLLGGWMAMLISYGILGLFGLLFHVKPSSA